MSSKNVFKVLLFLEMREGLNDFHIIIRTFCKPQSRQTQSQLPPQFRRRHLLSSSKCREDIDRLRHGAYGSLRGDEHCHLRIAVWCRCQSGHSAPSSVLNGDQPFASSAESEFCHPLNLLAKHVLHDYYFCGTFSGYIYVLLHNNSFHNMFAFNRL